MEGAAAKNKQALTKKTFEVRFDLDNTNYVAEENIGSGAYGVVCSALNKSTKEKVAIKKIPNIFEQEVIAKRTYREIKILKHFKHDNIIAIREILKPPMDTKYPRDVYIVLDLMESDLHRIIHSRQELSIDHTKYFLYQILCGLNYIHSANVVHRDLKPSNLLVNANCDLKIGDFGMARGMGFMDTQTNNLTMYVATRWYRAPELICSSQGQVPYTDSVDMWSVGCIFAELLGRKIIFQGRNPLEQFNVIMDTLGAPPQHLQQTYHEMHRRIIRAHGNRLVKSLRERLPKSPELAMELLEKLLVFDPSQRLDVAQSLKHPFLAKYHDPDSVYEKPCIPQFDFDFEKINMTSDQLKDAILKEVMDYHKPRPVCKIPFNFKPVSKSDLEKSQQLKEAAMKKRREASATQEAKTGLASFLKEQKSKRQHEQNTESNSFLNQTHSDNQTGLNAFLSRNKNHENTGLNVFMTQNSDLPNSGLGAFLKYQNASQSSVGQSMPKGNREQINDIFKVPQGMPLSKQTLQVSTQSVPQVDVEMVSAGRSGQKLCQVKSEDSDIEMLSAKSEYKLDIGTDFKIDLTSDNNVAGNKYVERSEHNKNDTHVTKKDDVKDEKLDAKAKLKAAILNKERGEPSQPKRVTALQRQREKEEKRRKKLARAKEKKKQTKIKEHSPLLTDADRELLQRWSKMQNPKNQELSNSSASNDRPPQEQTSSVRPALSPKNANVQAVSAVSFKDGEISRNNNISQQSLMSAEVKQNATLNSQNKLLSNKTPNAQTFLSQTSQPYAPLHGVSVQNTGAAIANACNVSVPQTFLGQTFIVTQPAQIQTTTQVQFPHSSLLGTYYQNVNAPQIGLIKGASISMNAQQMPQNSSNNMRAKVVIVNRGLQNNCQNNAKIPVNSTLSQNGSSSTQNYEQTESQPTQPVFTSGDILLSDQHPLVMVSNTIGAPSPETNTSLMPPSQKTNTFSPSEFLPFQTYDNSNVNVDLTSQLPTPDFSFVSPSSISSRDNKTSEDQSVPVLQDSPQASTSGLNSQTNEPSSARNDRGIKENELSIITQQLKRSHVNDPLFLPVTPKTAGEPYGVGPEILPEMFLAEDRQSAQMSAISGGAASATESMMGDWLDLIGMDGETLNQELQALENRPPQQVPEGLAQNTLTQ